MMAQITISLTEEEYGHCKRLGILRTKNNRAHGVKPSKHGKSDQRIFYDIYGTLGEYAFCKMFGVPFDDTISVRVGGEDTVVNGVTVDIKSTNMPNGRLLATTKKLDRLVDVFVLMISEDGHTWKFVGWATSDELLCPENLLKTNPAYPDSYGLSQSSLHDPEDFLCWTLAMEYSKDWTAYQAMELFV